MILNVAPLSPLQSSQQPFVTQLTKCIFSSSFSKSKEKKKDRTLIHNIQYFPKSRKLLDSLFKVDAMKRSCSANFDDGNVYAKEGFDDSEENVRLQRSSNSSFFQSSLEILDPIALGIRPEPPENWLERESILSIDFEQKAKRFDVSISIRMIQKKIQLGKGFKVLEESSAYCSVKKALSSMVFIMIELQSAVLKMREVLCNEDLEMIINKVQKDMHSPFVWLFQQVFSKTPTLMIYVMILLANFSLHSTSLNVAVAQASLASGTTTEMASTRHSDNETSCETSSNLSKSKTYTNLEEFLQIGDPELKNAAEVVLWNSMLDETIKMQENQMLEEFVSPISAEMETDNYVEYSKTDLKYQIGLSQDPNNPLLLCNYAKFLLLVVHDPDRAEECLKRAVQVKPPDADSHIMYADFLWRIRNDLWAAEQSYLEGIAADPNNSYHVSEYAEFLWRTGGEETCYPLCTSDKND